MGGIMEHIEEAGNHSGNSLFAAAPLAAKGEKIAETRRLEDKKLALALEVGGLMNVQYALKGDEIYVLEVNPRAARTVPFVAKVIGVPIAKIAARIMAGESLSSFPGSGSHRISITSASRNRCYPFARFPGVDTVLGPEMRSTGEVMGIDRSFDRVRQEPARRRNEGRSRAPSLFPFAISTSSESSSPCALLQASGSKFWRPADPALSHRRGVKAEKVNKVSESRPHAADPIKNGDIQLMFNTTEGATARRFAAVAPRRPLAKVPYYTTISGAIAAAEGIRAVAAGELEVRALQDYLA